MNQRTVTFIIVLAVATEFWVTPAAAYAPLSSRPFIVKSSGLQSSFIQSRVFSFWVGSPSHRFMSTAAGDEILVNQLIESVEQRGDSQSSAEDDQNIKAVIHQLTRNNSTDVDFDALIGYYNVSCTLTARPKDNPVGGKWTRRGSTQNLWVIRRTLQHVLPKRPNGLANAVAQAVNVIRLDLLFGWIPVWIVLRGDAVPLNRDDDDRNAASNPKLLPDLSPWAIRAYFDRPRIAFGKIVFSFGPTSSVVLDTPYVDQRIRIGKGGTSGTLFVFRRVPEDDTEATTEWKWLLDEDRQKSFVTKRKAAVAVGLVGIMSALTAAFFQGLTRTLSVATTLLSSICLIWITLGTGGIETRGDTYARGK